MWESEWADRGLPWEYDPGPPPNRSWARLFAETPNYRGLGFAVTGGEAFRWHFGPMFYRGRLGDAQVKVLIVGQEGAQDESLAHRSFAGGTGARMQHVLNHLGVTGSYLFLNTFVYPIFGQYDDELPILAQDPASPISKHRNRILDYAAARNDLQLALAVGTAAKESLATWVRCHGGTATPSRLHEADARTISPRLRMLGVLHPGGASKGGNVTKIVADFKTAIRRVERWAQDDPGWLTPDPDGVRQPAAEYRYRSAPIPFRDFPYGLAWRLGRGGTSSNRREDQTAIQLFSADGTYNNTGQSLSYPADTASSDDGYSQPSGDLPYEPPRVDYKDFDRGPGPQFSRLLQGGDPAFPWPDFSGLGLRCHPSFGFGPVYRGRLDSPSILVLADQASHDDLFTGRALTGDAGQHLQAFLRAAGLTYAYGVLRVLPVDTLAETQTKVRSLIDHSATAAVYQEALRRAHPDVVLTVGPYSERLVTNLSLGGIPVVAMQAHRKSDWTKSWQDALVVLAGLAYPKDIPQPTFVYGGEREQIARHDLPFGTLRWQGSSGDRGSRATRSGGPSFDYYKFTMPPWTAALPPPPVSAADQQTADGLTP